MNSSAQFLRRVVAPLAGACAAFLASPLVAQTTATTDPVGFITLNVAGTGGTVPNQLSFEGLSLTRAVEYQGAAETSAAGTATIVDNDATWTDDQFNPAPNATAATATYYLEITSGPGAGTTYDIIDTVAATKTITLAQNLATGVANGSSFKIRKYWTIGTVFGTSNPPESGLQTGTSTTADQVLLYNGSSYDTYYYSSGGLVGQGWRKQGAQGADQTGKKFYPEDGVIVNRLQSANLSFVLMGSVKTGQTSTPVLSGLNFVSNVYAANMTLGDSGLFTDNTGTTGVLPGTATTADTVQIYNTATNTYDTYYYSSGGPIITAGWRKQGGANADQTSVPIPVGVSVIITRKGATGFNWVAPQHPASI